MAESPKLRILITYPNGIAKGSSYVQATLENDPNIWRTGNDESEAIGNLIWYCREKFNIEIVMPKEG